jgi:hypothetical protein
METLTSQWYNAVTTSLHLSPDQFQLVQGNIAVGSTSPGIWALMDSIPPQSISQSWTPQGYNSFSGQYGALISRLKDSSYGSFQAAMGSYYTAWMSYLQAHPPATVTPQAVVAEFQGWSAINMPADQAQTALSLLAAAFNGPIAQANILWAAAGGPSGVKAYQQTIETIDYTIGTAPSGGAQLDSATESSDTSHTWAKGAVEGFYEVFFGEAGAEYDATTLDLTQAGLAITAQFDHVATIPVLPLAQGTVVSGPTTYQPWFVPQALSNGYENNNYNVWQPGSPSWSSFFGDGGSLLRTTTALIVVDGITISMTSEYQVQQSEQQQVKTEFAAGFFPFFGVEGEGGWSNSVSFSDSGEITATSTNPVGSPQILGILQSPINSVIGGMEVQAALRAARNGSGISLASLPAGVTVAAAQPPGGKAEVEVEGEEAEGAGGGGRVGVGAALIVTVAWTAAALQGLHALGVSPAIEQLIAGQVTNWAQNSAPGWAVGAPHQYNSNYPQYVATAQVVAVNGGNRTVNVVAFV